MVHAYRIHILKFLSKSDLLHHCSLTLDVTFKYFLPIRQRTELHCNHYNNNAQSSHTARLSLDFQVTLGCIYVETESTSWPIAWPVSKECLSRSLTKEWKWTGFFQRPVPVYLFSLIQCSWSGWPTVTQINSCSESVDLLCVLFSSGKQIRLRLIKTTCAIAASC